MVKKISKGSLLGRSSSSSKDKTGLYLVSVVAIVAVVALFLMVKGGSSEVSGETVMVADEEGNLIGEAFRNSFGSPSKSTKKDYKLDFNPNLDGSLVSNSGIIQPAILRCSDFNAVNGECYTDAVCAGWWVCSGDLMVPAAAEQCAEDICAKYGSSVCKNDPRCSASYLNEISSE